ncbi:MAG TPA: hypothetical protein VNZ44_10865, partial [Pyrinomonadaceae bacterium]|nr:hypothetical protein [Pyrinomonadaceae bacterium]
MNNRTRTLLLLFALLLSPAHARARATQAQTPAQTRPQAQTEKDEKKKEGPRRFETVQFESRLAGAPLPYNVILPADYKRGSSKAKRYPVLYLLH